MSNRFENRSETVTPHQKNLPIFGILATLSSSEWLQQEIKIKFVEMSEGEIAKYPIFCGGKQRKSLLFQLFENDYANPWNLHTFLKETEEDDDESDEDREIKFYLNDAEARHRTL